MRRGFLNNPKASKEAKPAPPEVATKAPVIAVINNRHIYELKYGKVNYDDAVHRGPKPPNFTIDIDAASGILKSKLVTMHLVTVPERGSPAAANENDHSEWLTSAATKAKVFRSPGFPKPVPKPKGQTALCEVRETPNMGMGLFVTHNVEAGDIVFAERPLYVTPVNLNVFNLGLDGTARTAKLVLDESEKVVEVAVNRMSESNQLAYRALMNSHTEDGSGPLMGIVRTNGYVVGEIFDGDGVKAEDDFGCYSVIGNLASRINHSCIYNVDRKFDPAAFALVFRATRDLKAGDQIFSAYSNTKVPVAERRKQLAPYGIVCECRRCVSANPFTDKFLEEFDRRTEKYGALNQEVYSDVNKTWPTDQEIKQLQKFRQVALDQGLDHEVGYLIVLNSLAIGYGKRGMIGKVQEILMRIQKYSVKNQKGR